MGAGTWDVVDLVLALVFMAGFFYYYVAGVVDGNRALTRTAALAFIVCAIVAIVMLARITL